LSDATFSQPATTLAEVLAEIRALKATLASSSIESLPAEFARSRILDSDATYKFVGSSAANWRRLRAAGIAPKPVLIGAKKHGYRVGDLVDYLERRKQAASADEPRRDPRHALTQEPAHA
jgi:hypothetical protein